MNRSTTMKWLAAAVSAVVVASLLGAVFVIGSPLEQRKIRLDNRRLEDLHNISKSIRKFAQNPNNVLPPDLQTLGEIFSEHVPTDPDTDMPYKYKVLDAQSYQLCAVFLRPSPGSYRLRHSDYDYDWRRTHAAGEQCFKYTIKEQ